MLKAAGTNVGCCSYQMQPLVLRFNGGMQFTRAQTHNLQVLRKKYEILADLTRLGV